MKSTLEEGCHLPEGSISVLKPGAICQADAGAGLVSSRNRAVRAIGLESLALTVHLLQISSMCKSQRNFNGILFSLYWIFLSFSF